jgi:hypothetical protein
MGFQQGRRMATRVALLSMTLALGLAGADFLTAHGRASAAPPVRQLTWVSRSGEALGPIGPRMNSICAR